MKYVNEFWSSTDDKPLAKISADWAEQASVIWWLKIVLLLLPMFYLLLQLLSLLKIIKFCRRLSTFVFVYFYCNPHTYKISLPVNTIIFFCLFYRYYWNYKIALPVAIILVLFNWRTGKTKIHILLYTMQHCINFYNYTTFIQLFINFINSNFKNYRHCKC